MRKKRLSRLLSTLLALAVASGSLPAALAAPAFDAEASQTAIEETESEKENNVDRVTISADKDKIKIGESLTLKATVHMEEGKDTKGVRWAVSSSPSDAKVTQTSDKNTLTVSCDKVCTLTITASSEENSTVSDEITIEVEPIPVESLSIHVSELSLGVDESEKLDADLSPSTATNQTIHWKSSNESAVIVYDDGRVVAVGEGTSTITATSDDNPKAAASCKITVTKAPVSVTGVKLNTTSTTVGINQTVQITATVSPADATDKTLSWRSDNPSVATVDQDGKVTAKAIGTAAITAATRDGNYTASCTVEVVTGKVSDINLSVSADKTLTLDGGIFNRVSTGVYGNNLNYVRFYSNSSHGTLYYDYDNKTGDSAGKISPTTKYFYSSGSKLISDITYVPDESYTGEAVFTYIAYDNRDNSYEGRVVIQVKGPSGDVNYKTARNEAVRFDGGDFNRVCRRLTGETLDYILFEGDVATSKGDLYYRYENGGYDRRVSTSTEYYYNGSPDIGDISFVPARNFSGTVTIPFRGRSTGRISFSGVIEISVDGSGGYDLRYTTGEDEAVTFKSSDFNDFCREKTGAPLEYVRFTPPKSTRGALYYDYGGRDEEEVVSSDRFYRSDDPDISDVTFLPDDGYTGTVEIDFDGRSVDGDSFTGTLEIDVDGEPASLTYTTGKNDPVSLLASDFNSYCREENGASLDYVRFTLPSSSRGVLYYDYEGRDEEKLSSSERFYRSGSPNLDDVTFVPDSGYTGAVEIKFTGRDIDGGNLSGTVKIKVGTSSEKGDIHYTTGEDEPVTFDDDDFNSFCKSENRANLDYVKFTLPKSSQGILYYDYDEKDEEKVSSSDRFYRSSSPRLDRVTFVPDDGYTGAVEIKFTGRDSDGDAISGTVTIQVGEAGGDIHYTAAAGSAVAFELSDFTEFCKDETGYNLDYVKFSLPASSRGTLYYKYDQDDEKEVKSSTEYYRSSSPRLSDVAFVPAKNVTGTVEISFTGRSTDKDSISGTVTITYTEPKDAAPIRYSGSGVILFQAKDFESACNARGAAPLSSVRFTPPPANAGKLYYNYQSPAKNGGQVNPALPYSVNSGALLSYISFVPKAGFSGPITITYTGTDTKGATYTGTVEVTVTPAAASTHFTDMGSASWAAASVDFLYQYGITTGMTATTYGPSGNITRGDFVLMLYRAFNLSAAANGNFSDVPSNSYYAQAIATAKALGIAQGSEGNKFHPTAKLTREDAMVLLQRTLTAAGINIAAADESYLSRFSDGASVSSYAKGAVASLVQAGVIQGDTSGKLNPKGSLTRAEMAVTLHRVLTL